MKKTSLPESFPEKVLFSSTFDGDFQSIETNSMTLTVKDGPEEVWIGRPHTGISGAHTLCVTGHSLIGKASATLFDSLNITVSEDTVFTYHIFPFFSGEHYDFEYSQMYFALGIYFTNGSRAELVDQNGNALTPVAQGKSRTLYTHQWNQLYASLSAYAGKVIDKVTK